MAEEDVEMQQEELSQHIGQQLAIASERKRTRSRSRSRSESPRFVYREKDGDHPPFASGAAPVVPPPTGNSTGASSSDARPQAKSPPKCKVARKRVHGNVS